METNFTKLMDLMFITANEIAYPQHAPPNQSSKAPPKNEKKYPIWDYRNLTDNQGWLKINIDYKKYKPKKYYLDTSEEVLQKHLNALQKKQNLLKNFKYYQDFDRIDYQNAERPITFENHIQKMMLSHIVFSIFLSRVLIINFYPHHFSYTLWRKFFGKTYFATLPLILFGSLFLQQANPVNHEFFRSNPKQIRMYQGLAYDLDAYQDVNDIKYNYKYPERNQFNKTVWQIHDKKDSIMYQDSIKYFKRTYGIVDPQPYLNKNQSKSEQTNN